MLHDGAPQIDFAVYAEPGVARPAQIGERFGCVDGAGAVHLRRFVEMMRCIPDESSACRRQRPTRIPRLRAERLQASRVPLPRTIGDDWRNVVWYSHRLAGTDRKSTRLNSSHL